MSVLAISMRAESSNLQFNTGDHWTKFRMYLFLVLYISNIVSPPLSTYRGEGRRRMEKGKKKGRGGGRYERRKQKA